MLGAMLVAEPTLTRVIDEVKLHREDFYLDKHKAIFEVVHDLYAASKPVDELSVSEALTQRNQIEDAGGRHYVSELAAKVPAAANAKHYAEIVQQNSLLRRLLGAGQEIQGWVNERAGEPRELARKAGDLLEGIPAPAGRLAVRQADLASVRPIRWGWQDRLLLGYLNLLLGAEGVGKGTLAAWVMAELTRGRLPGDLDGVPSRVLILGDEDAFDSVWTPRLYAADADLELIDALEDEFDFAAGAEPLRQLITKRGYKMVFFDQLLDNLGADIDDWRSKEVRDRLRPARRIARELDVVMLGALHPNKGQRSNFRDLVSGSHAFNASSRSSLLLAQHPDDETKRVLVRGKGNLSAPPPSFEFAIEGRDLQINGYRFSLPVVAEPADGCLTVDDVMKPQREAPVRSTLADEIDALGTGEVQSRADIAKALGRSSDDRSVGRALDQLEAEDRWEKVGRGKWKAIRLGIGSSKEAPMSNQPAGSGP